MSWKLNHDAADGRIPDEGVDDSIEKLTKTRNESVEELKVITGLQTHKEISKYIQEQLNEQDKNQGKEWKNLYREGAIFKISGDGKYNSDVYDVFETVRTYLPIIGMSGPNKFILSRPHGSNRFVLFDDRDILELIKIDDIKPIYQGENLRGIIKADEETEKRISTPVNNTYEKWIKFREEGTVFTHLGFNETFETFERFNLPNKDRKNDNEVILAKSYDTLTFVEFTTKDLGAMKLLNITPKYTKRDGDLLHCPKLILYK